MARPKKYADNAARQAAHRARNNVIEARLSNRTVLTLDKLASELDVPRTEVINSLVQFALLNRNWHTLGLFGKRLDRVIADEERGAANDAAAEDAKGAQGCLPL